MSERYFQDSNRSKGPRVIPKSDFNSVLSAARQPTVKGQKIDNTTITKRLMKFFLYNSNEKSINLKEGYFCPRRQPLYSEGQYPLDNQIILYGIDFMKQRQIEKRYKCQNIVYIDSSHVMLKYPDFLMAHDALAKNQREQVQENKLKLQEQGQLTKSWMEMKPYTASKYERRIIARYATNQQKDLQQKETKEFEKDSAIACMAEQVYNRKKRQSEQIETNYQQRRRQLNQRRNRDQMNQSCLSFNIDPALKLDSLNSSREQEISLNQPRQRSRQKGISSPIRIKNIDDDKMSIASKSDIGSMLGRMGNLDIDDDKGDYDISSILGDQQLNQQIQRNLMIDFQNRSDTGSLDISYRLSDNMPGPKKEDPNIKKIKKKFIYSDYIAQKQEEQQRRREETRTVINIDDV